MNFGAYAGVSFLVAVAAVLHAWQTRCVEMFRHEEKPTGEAGVERATGTTTIGGCAQTAACVIRVRYARRVHAQLKRRVSEMIKVRAHDRFRAPTI